MDVSDSAWLLVDRRPVVVMSVLLALSLLTVFAAEVDVSVTNISVLKLVGDKLV